MGIAISHVRSMLDVRMLLVELVFKFLYKGADINFQDADQIVVKTFNRAKRTTTIHKSNEFQMICTDRIGITIREQGEQPWEREREREHGATCMIRYVCIIFQSARLQYEFIHREINVTMTRTTLQPARAFATFHGCGVWVVGCWLAQPSRPSDLYNLTGSLPEAFRCRYSPQLHDIDQNC